MTVCKVQECKITTKFNTFFRVGNSAFFFFLMKQYTEMGFLIILKMHIPAVTFEIVTGLSKIKKKKSATENYPHVQFKVDTSSSSISSMLAPEVDSVRKT